MQQLLTMCAPVYMKTEIQFSDQTGNISYAPQSQVLKGRECSRP